MELWTMWRFEPLPIAATLLLALLYGLGMGPLRRRLFPGRDFPFVKALVFYSALLILTLMFVSPLHTIGEFYLLWVHMLTMMTIIFLVALLLLGVPGWLLGPLVSLPVVRPLPLRIFFTTTPTLRCSARLC